MSLKEEAARLIENYLNSNNFYTRFYATKALGALAPEGEPETLIAIARNTEEDVDLRVEALFGLCRYGKGQDTSELEELLFDHEGDIRTHAAKAIGAIGGDQSAEVLLKAMMDQGDGYGYDDEFDWDPQWDVQLEVIKALGNLGAQKAVGPIVELYEQEEGLDIGETVFQALRNIGGPEVLEFFSSKLKEGVPAERRRVCEIIGETEFIEMKGTLISVLLDQDPQVRAAAAKALAVVGGEHEKTSLALLLRDSQGTVVKSVLEAMEEKNLLEGLEEHVKPLLDNDSLVVQTAALKALGSLGSFDLNDKLNDCLKNGIHDEIIFVAASLMIKSSPVDAQPLILNIIIDTNREPLLRIQLMGLYEKFYSERVAADLLESLEAGPRQASIAMADIIARRGDEEALDSICEMLGALDTGQITESDGLELVPSEDTKGFNDEGEPEFSDGTKMIKGKKAVKYPGATPGGLRPTDIVFALMGSHSENIGKWITPLIHSENPEVASRAITALGELGVNPGENEIIEIISQTNPQIRAQAVYLAGKLGVAHDLVIERLGVDYDENVRDKSAMAVTAVGGDVAIAALIEGLKDPSPQVRKSCIVGLGFLKADSSVNPLLTALFDYENFSDLTTEICDTLFELDSETVKEALAATLSDPSKEETHWIALDALGRIFA